MHLNQLFTYGSIHRYLLPQNFHLGVRHHLHVKYTPISISIYICILLQFFLLVVVAVVMVLFLLLPLHTLFFLFFFFFSLSLLSLHLSNKVSTEYIHQKVKRKPRKRKPRIEAARDRTAVAALRPESSRRGGRSVCSNPPFSQPPF